MSIGSQLIFSSPIKASDVKCTRLCNCMTVKITIIFVNLFALSHFQPFNSLLKYHGLKVT